MIPKAFPYHGAPRPACPERIHSRQRERGAYAYKVHCVKSHVFLFYYQALTCAAQGHQLPAGREIACLPIRCVGSGILRIAGRTQDNEPISTHIPHLDRGTGRMSGRQGEAAQGSRAEGAMARHASVMRTQMRTHETCMQVVQNLYQCEPRMLWS